MTKNNFLFKIVGIYLINKDKMLFAHLEKEWGDEPETQQLLDALNYI